MRIVSAACLKTIQKFNRPFEAISTLPWGIKCHWLTEWRATGQHSKHIGIKKKKKLNLYCKMYPFLVILSTLLSVYITREPDQVQGENR